MSSPSDDDRRFQELTKKLDEKLFSGPKNFSESIDEKIRSHKKEALDKMDKAIKDGDLLSAGYHQAAYRWCKLALREY